MTEKNLVFNSPSGRPLLLDICYEDKPVNKPVILFLHGFKGFKDWGHCPLVSLEFARQGFVFIKFNFSHNGTTVENPIEFSDLEAFGKNTYSMELNEAMFVIDLIREGKVEESISGSEIHILGHSRGGGIALLAGCESNEISSIAAWAPIDSTGDRLRGFDHKKWKQDGVIFIDNARTKQKMPLEYGLLEDWEINQERLDIKASVRSCKKKILLIHGTSDEAVDPEGSRNLASCGVHVQLELIEGAGHTFGGRHPWDRRELPDDTLTAIRLTALSFLD